MSLRGSDTFGYRFNHSFLIIEGKRERKEAAFIRQTMHTAKAHFLQVLIDTPGNKASYLVPLKLSAASEMF